MRLFKFLTATACVAAFTAGSTSAFASPAQDGVSSHHGGPPLANPHDVFRPVIRSARPDPAIAAKACACAMLQAPRVKTTPND